MKLPQSRQLDTKKLLGNIRRNYLAMAFLIPFLGMLMLMMICGYEPFGSYSMLYSDMYHQYFPFFVEFRRSLLRGQSLLYNWSTGLGMDYLGLISYYLASPLNLLSVLVPESLLLEFFSLLMPVKLGLASLFFAIFLKKAFGKYNFSVAVFGSFYGLCAWALGYQWNIMWLDTFALLPLVALGTLLLIRDGKFLLYTLTLFLSVFSNYYIGFFTCIFVFLMFFSTEICLARGWKAFFKDLLRIALFSAIAIGMTAILELPALAALQSTQSSVNQFPKGFRLNISSNHNVWGLLDAMRQVAGNMGGGAMITFKEGLPNIYCGVGSLLLAVLFLLSGDFKLRDKLCSLFLLLFFNVSFIIRQLDYIWHGFHFTNMIPYRFSFLYSFVVLTMAYRLWTKRRKLDSLQIAAGTLLTVAILACSDYLQETIELDLGFTKWDAPLFVMFNGLFLVLYVAGLLYSQIHRRMPEKASEEEKQEDRARWKARRKNARAVLLGVMTVELVANLTCFGIMFPGTNTVNYPKGTKEAASMIRYMKEREKYEPFYRAEVNHSQTLNDGALNGYCGISAFTSSANVKVTEFMKRLGYGAKNTYNRYCYEESSPIPNLFLGIKYMIERDGKDKGSVFFEDVHHYGDVHLLENRAYLPLGFLAESGLKDLSFGPEDADFTFQNHLFNAATGLDGNVMNMIPAENLVMLASNAVLGTKDTTTGYCTYSQCTEGASVVYTYTAHRDGFMCIRLDLPKRNHFTVSLNGAELFRENISLPQMLAVGDVKTGDTIDVMVKCGAGEDSYMTVTAAIVDGELFGRGYEVLSRSVMNISSFESDLILGSIDCDRAGLLYTSVPQNGNWQVWVDREKTEPALVGDVMIGVELDPGYHEIWLRYKNPAFRMGWKISLGCAVLLTILTVRDYKKRKQA